MSKFGQCLACLFVLGIGTPALAIENWTVTDLGSARTESICVNAATESFVSYGNVFGAERLLRTDWTVYAYGLANSDHDAVVTCTFATANSTRATLVVYSQDEIQGGLISHRIAQEFYAQNQRLEAEWLQKAYNRFGF